MNGYRVIVLGRHVRVVVEGEEQVLAFYVNAFVNGASQNAAERSALKLVFEKLQEKEGVVLDNDCYCAVDEVYEFLKGSYLEPELEGFIFFGDGENPSNSTLLGKLRTFADAVVDTVKFRIHGFKKRPVLNDEPVSWAQVAKRGHT